MQYAAIKEPAEVIYAAKPELILLYEKDNLETSEIVLKPSVLNSCAKALHLPGYSQHSQN